MNIIRILTLTAVLTVWCGCSGEKGKAAGSKVVSLSPAATEIVLALDGKPALAGRSSACTMSRAAGIPVVGDMGLPFAEPVLSSGAQTVLTDSVAPSLAWMQLEKCGMKKVVLPGNKLDDLPSNIRTVGEIIGKQPQAEKLAGKLSQHICQLRRQVPVQQKRALVVISLPPVVSCGADSFIHEALLLAGAENIAAGAGKGYFAVSTEFICHTDPEVIISFLPPGMTEKYFSRNEFRNMTAVRNRQIFYPDPDKFCRLAPQLPAEISKLKSLLAGDIRQK
ncbi:MAG: ABC transporter substrate-binding protein [Lentisphaeria bacterium]|nr:ABC transporter substrate-binding protein [Lentisphaeria bacterium]